MDVLRLEEVWSHNWGDEICEVQPTFCLWSYQEVIEQVFDRVTYLNHKAGWQGRYLDNPDIPS